nr:MAG TPA: hypothetical protein [Caudoviricetes sp.]
MKRVATGRERGPKGPVPFLYTCIKTQILLAIMCL